MKFSKLIPEITVSNLEKSLKFYKTAGFKIEYERPEDKFVFLSIGEIQFMLQEDSGSDKWDLAPLSYPYGNGINFQLEVDNVDKIYNNLKENGYEIAFEMEENWYRQDDCLLGNKEFLVQDPDGYLLRFSEDLGKKNIDSVSNYRRKNNKTYLEYVDEEKRMNKEELIELINSLKLNKNEFWILSSSALVIRGIYPDAGDLDIAVTEKGLEELKKNYNLIQKDNGWYIVNEKVECVVDTKEPWKIEEYEGFNLQSIEKYYDYLKNSNREKDKARIPLVEEYMKNIDVEKCQKMKSK